jgi:PAS domain S-box-containing protein
MLCGADMPDTFLVRHRTGSLWAAGGLILLIVANSFLYLNFSRRKQAEEALRGHQRHLEDLVRERSAQLETLNSQLRLDILERERTERALRQAEASFRDLFENAAEGIYQTTPDGKLLAVNPALSRMAGFDSPAQMIAEIGDVRRDFFVYSERRQDFEEMLRSQGEVQGFETCVRRRGGEVIWVLENARATHDETGKVAHYEGILQDITERKRALEALRESQQLLNKTFASLRDALLIVNAGTRAILDCNPAITKLFGYERAEVLGQSARMLHVDAAAFEQFRDSALAAIRERGYLDLSNFRMKRKDGETFITRHTVLPLYAEDGALVSWVSVIRDITESKRNEEKLEQYQRKLRALAAELTVVEARERRAIAAQLHENVGQILATSKMKIAYLRTAAGAPTLQAGVAEIQELVEEALQATRSLTYQLSPPILYQLGLEAALKWLGENAEKQHGFRVLFSRQGESGSLDEESRVFLFSAVRELLVNVAKHAGASEVGIRLRWHEDRVDVLVRDNGRGFQRANGTAFPESPDGFGLFNIQERVSDMGGQVWVHAEPLRGTAVKIELPCEPAAPLVEAHT